MSSWLPRGRVPRRLSRDERFHPMPVALRRSDRNGGARWPCPRPATGGCGSGRRRSCWAPCRTRSWHPGSAGRRTRCASGEPCWTSPLPGIAVGVDPPHSPGPQPGSSRAQRGHPLRRWRQRYQTARQKAALAARIKEDGAGTTPALLTQQVLVSTSSLCRRSIPDRILNVRPQNGAAGG